MDDKNTLQPALTPEQLADKLQRVIRTVQNLAETPNGNEWAKKAVERHLAHFKRSPKDFSESGVQLPLAKAKELCPELYEQLIKPGIEMANEAGKLHKTPELPTYIVINEHIDNMSYDGELHSIEIGLPYLRKRENMNESIAVIAHEWGHAHQDLQYRIKKNFTKIGHLPANNEGKEYMPPSYFPHRDELYADRHSSAAMDNIASFLTGIINTQGDYTRKSSSHPPHRERIEALLKQEMGNEIFGMNGQWVKKSGNYSFIPNTLEASHRIVKDRVREKIGEDRVSPDPYGKFSVTEEGLLVKNGYQLRIAAEEKSEELMLKLDVLVKSGFNLKKKHIWLKMANAEVAKFKKENQPEFLDKKEVLQRGWADKAQRTSLKFQRGG